MNNQPLVSICIPVYNRENLIIETLNSAINQTYVNIEVIVSDNKSTDKTFEVVSNITKKHSNVKIVQTAENFGPVVNWKNAIKNSKGEFVLLLYSDDIIETNYVEECVKRFDNSTSFVLVENVEFRDQKILNHNKYSFNKINSNNYISQVLFLNKHNFPPSPSAALFKREYIIDNIYTSISNKDGINFNETGAGPDVLFFLFSAIQNKYVQIVQMPLLKNRSHNNSITFIENNKNGLKLNYDWAKFFFVKYHCKQFFYKLFFITIYRYFKYNRIHKNILLSFLK